MRKSIIKDNKVINIIELEEGAEWEPPEGSFIGPDGGENGDDYNPVSKTYTTPERVRPVIPDNEKAQNELNDLDRVLTRAEEDIMSALINKGVLELSDFGTTIKNNYTAKADARFRRNI